MAAIVFALSLAVHAGMAAPPRPNETTLSTRGGVASQSAVLGALLGLLSKEDAELTAALAALYGAAFVSTKMENRADVERYLTGVLAARYKGSTEKTVFAALVRYQGVIAIAFRHPERASNLRSRTVQILSTLSRPNLDQFTTRAEDWLIHLQDSLSKSAEIDMVQLQSLVSQRQQSLQLASNLIAALADASRQVAHNLPAEPDPADSTKTSKGGEGGAGSGSACPPCGCTCP